ncbi:MAG: nucleoside hydrolase [Actinomycetota bacterium]|nr:nucleoside hydrolase [Actinomycetota bacterium]
MSPRPTIVLDCDPGQDDAMAILLAARHLDVVGITTVHGNQSLDKVTRNALKILTLASLEHIPVHPGAARPFVGEAHHAAEVHGETGLDGAQLPEPAIGPRPRHAVDFLREAAVEHEPLTLVATGPLTNVAAALQLDPALAGRLEQITLMGGAVTGGNVTPAAEFNIWADPEAARLVLRSGVPIRMAGLDLTHQAIVGPQELDRLRATGTRVGEICVDLLSFYSARASARTGLAGAPLHDPCAVAWMIDPSLIEARPMHVDVELHGELTRGMTVCDSRPVADDAEGTRRQPVRDADTAEATSRLAGAGVEPDRYPPSNAEVGLRLDTARFFDLFVETVRTYG